VPYLPIHGHIHSRGTPKSHHPNQLVVVEEEKKKEKAKKANTLRVLLSTLKNHRSSKRRNPTNELFGG
jgi:hypothetical protein